MWAALQVGAALPSVVAGLLGARARGAATARRWKRAVTALTAPSVAEAAASRWQELVECGERLRVARQARRAAGVERGAADPRDEVAKSETPPRGGGRAARVGGDGGASEEDGDSREEAERARAAVEVANLERELGVAAREGGGGGGAAFRKRTAAEELEIGRSYDGPRMRRECWRVKTPGRFAAALEATSFPNARLIAELYEYERCGGMPLRYEGPRDVKVVCKTPKASWLSMADLHPEFQKQHAEGRLLIFDTLADVDAWSDWYFISPCKMIAKA